MKAKTYTEEQKNIFAAVANEMGKHICIIARAGCGKTFTVIELLKYIVGGFRILFTTFAIKNGEDLLERVKDVRATVLRIGQLSFRTLAKIWGRLQFSDKADFYRAHKAIEKLSVKLSGDLNPNYIARKITEGSKLAKAFFLMPSIEDLTTFLEQKEVQCEGKYKDYNDMLPRLVLNVLEQTLERSYYIESYDPVWICAVKGYKVLEFDIVIIDEFQDLSLPQMVFLLSLLAKNGRFIVVGDDRQSLYSWRGSMADCFGYFKNLFNQVVCLPLTVTFRCPKKHVELAKQYVDDYQAADCANEGTLIDLNQNQMMEQLAIGDTILSRLNAPLMPICLDLIKRGTPAKIAGRDIARGIIDMINEVEQSKESMADFIPAFEEMTQKHRVALAAQQNRNTTKMIEALDDKADVILTLCESVTTRKELLAKIDFLFVDQTHGNMVLLSSVHKAKGLEWNRTFILQSTLRGSPSVKDEESNINYVAYTRSRDYMALVA